MLNSIALRCYMLHFYFLCFVVKHFVICMCAFSKPLGDTQTQSPDESTFYRLSHDDWQVAATSRGVSTSWESVCVCVCLGGWRQIDRGRQKGRKRCRQRRSKQTSERLNLKWKIEQETDGRTLIRMDRQRRESRAERVIVCVCFWGDVGGDVRRMLHW